MSAHSRKHLRELKEQAGEHGFRYIGTTRRGHYRWQHPDGHIVITSSAYGSWREMLNAVRVMRQLSTGQRKSGRDRTMQMP